jgi:hypothetical protein
MKTTILAAPAVLLILAASACTSPGRSTATAAAKHSAAVAAAPAPRDTTPVAAPSPATSAPATPSPSSSPIQAPQVIARFNGSGIENTQPFTVPDSWHLSWAYWACDGGTGNFIVDEENTDGSVDFNGISVNELGAGGGPVATYAYGDAGTHYFSVDSECSWSLAVVIGGA